MRLNDGFGSDLSEFFAGFLMRGSFDTVVVEVDAYCVPSPVRLSSQIASARALCGFRI